MLYIFREYQTKETRKTFGQTNMELAHCHFDLVDPYPWNYYLWLWNLVWKLLFSTAPMVAFVKLPQPQETVWMAQSRLLYPKIDWSQIMLYKAIQAVLSLTD